MQADPAERTPVRPGLRHLSGHTDSVRGHVLRLSLPVQLPLPGRPPPLDPSGASGARDAGGHPRARPTAAVPPELCQRPPSSRQAEVLRRADHSGHGAADCGPPVFRGNLAPRFSGHPGGDRPGGLSLPTGQFRGFSGLWRILPAPARPFSRYPCPDSPVLWRDLFGGGPAQPGSGAAASRAVHAAG